MNKTIDLRKTNTKSFPDQEGNVVLAHIDAFGSDLTYCSVAELAERHATLKALDVANLDEFSGPAETRKSATLYTLAEAHKEACEKEAAKARAEAERIERERIERDRSKWNIRKA